MEDFHGIDRIFVMRLLLVKTEHKYLCIKKYPYVRIRLLKDNSNKHYDFLISHSSLFICSSLLFKVYIDLYQENFIKRHLFLTIH
jgi:hypothetical protein